MRTSKTSTSGFTAEDAGIAGKKQQDELREDPHLIPGFVHSLWTFLCALSAPSGKKAIIRRYQV
jgi:hypothetical protein